MQAESLAQWLARQGVGARDHVAILAANSPLIVAAKYAVWSLGAVAVPVSARSTVDEVSGLLEHARAKFLLCDSERAPVARAAVKQVGIAGAACQAQAPFRPRGFGRTGQTGQTRRTRPTDLAVIAYTSGTTGAPKGVMISHENLLWASLACSGARGDIASGVGACLSPLTHTPVFVSHLLCRILTGQRAVLVEKFDVDAVLDIVARYGVTDLTLIAGMVFNVVERGKVPARVRRSVDKVSVGGAATPMAAKEALAEIFDGADIIEAYGQSESTDGVTMARGGSVFSKPGTIGCPNPYITVDVVGSNGKLAQPGEEGEIVIGGPTIMQGYYRNKKATAEAMNGPWLRTGDLGRRDDDRFLFITGRAKDLIITGGENVSPSEVEDVLRRHPKVAEVAVIGTPHARWGEQITAVVVPKNGARPDVQSIIDFAGESLAGFKKPRRVEFLDALPRNATNKVQTGKLRELLSREDT